MPDSFTTSLEDLDLGVSERQAFGVQYQRPPNWEALARGVQEGTLHLPPHPDWTGDTTNWTADPFHDRNWQFQHHTLRWLNPLRWAALEGDAGAAREWRRVARSWAQHNVPASRAPSVFSWKDMADGNRAIQLALGAPLLEADDTWFVDLLRTHVEWLSDEKHLATKNHALHQHLGLVVAASALRDRRALDLAVERMTTQFVSTFDEQGGNDEGSIGYHELNLKWWSQGWERVEAEGHPIPDYVADRLEAGRTALAHMVMPDGRLPQIGDTKRGPVSRGLGPQVEHSASQGRKGTAPTETLVAYDRGYVISRSGWGERRPFAQESHLLVRHGSDLRSHSHQDRGSVHIYTRGRTWLIDGGYFSYQTGDETRNHFLAREAHNVAQLPEFGHSDREDVDLERCAATPESDDVLLHDRGYLDVELRRRVTYLRGPDCWIVWDRTSAPTAIQQRWHVDAGVAVRRHDRGFDLRSGAQTVTMTWLGQLPVLARHLAVDGDLRGWIATKWKTLEPGALITAESQRNRDRCVVLIAPSAPQELAVVSSYLTVSGVLTAVLMRGPRVWDLRIEGEQVAIGERSRTWE